MSLYGDYIKEHRGDGIVEEQYGFATYRFLNNKKTVYIVDLYIHPEFRRTKLGSELTDRICEIAKTEGATEMIGTVVPSANNSTMSLKALLSYGMTLQSATQDLIIFRKDI